MVELSYDDIVKKLIYQHCHSDDKARKDVFQSEFVNGYDFDQVGKHLEECSDDLSFVHSSNGLVWYEQNEELLVYITEKSEIKLDNVGPMLHHLTPPELREKYGIISTGR